MKTEHWTEGHAKKKMLIPTKYFIHYSEQTLIRLGSQAKQLPHNKQLFISLEGT